MGVVYRALDRETGTPVALKMLLDDGADTGERFLREGRVLASLQHPNIVAYVAHGRSTAGTYYLAMEWLDGHDLEHHLTFGALSLGACRTLLEGVAGALAAGILGDLLRRHCGVGPSEASEAPGTAWGRLRAGVAGHLTPPDVERVAIFLGEMAGVHCPEAGNALLVPAREDPRILRDRIAQAFVDWLKAECGARPVVVLVDDLHWADPLSVALLDHALRALVDAPLLLVALARPEVKEQFPRLWQTQAEGPSATVMAMLQARAQRSPSKATAAHGTVADNSSSVSRSGRGPHGTRRGSRAPSHQCKARPR